MSDSECAPSAQRTKRKLISAGAALALAREMFPDLSGDGIRLKPGAVPQEIRLDQIETALQFFGLLRPTKHPTTDSGTLKHHAEDWGGINGMSSYVSRGALTVAAIAMGYPVRAYRYGGDVAIGVSIPHLRKINELTLTARIERRGRSIEQASI
jgi:hypothetical protein